MQDVAQAALPIRMRTVLGGRWSFDLSGAYAVGGIHVKTADFQGNSRRRRQASLTDRRTSSCASAGPSSGDRLVLTAGVNLPTGITRLDGDQTEALQVIAAPALRMPIGAYGTGAGGTLGLISAIERGEWALALGASVEQRTEYTPIAFGVSGSAGSETRLTPGTSVRVTLGADRLLGSTHLSVLILGDAYGKDKVVLASSGTQSGATEYKLGPQVAAYTRLDFGGGIWRDGALSVAARRRAEFTDAAGTRVEGSAGTYLDGSLGGVMGSAGGAGFVIGVDGLWHSGLSFTDAIVGAAATVGGATIGVEIPMGGTFFRFALHPQYGTFDTGTTKATGVGGTIVFSFIPRREAR